MHPVRRNILLVACATALSIPATSFAQSVEIARKLLEEAKKLKDANKIAEACPLLDRAYEMDAKDGILFARADCRDQERKIAAAVNLYEAYLRSFGRMTGQTRTSHTDRAATAEARLAELRPRVPSIKFVWDKPPPPETKIVVDKLEYRASTLDVRLPLEPGTHEIVVLLPGEPERRRTITLAEGASTMVDLTPLVPKTDDPSKTNTATPKPSRTSASSNDTKVDPWKVAGFVTVGLGAAGIVAGAITGGIAMSERRTFDEHCDGKLHPCDAEGLAAADRFQTAGNASTAAFIAGGVFAAAGATILIVAYSGTGTSNSTARLRATVRPHAVQLQLEGLF